MRLILMMSILILTTKSAFSYNQTFCDHPCNIFYSSHTGMLYLACNDSTDLMELITIDPLTGQEVRRFQTDEHLVACVAVDSGVNLLTLQKSKLIKLNAISGLPVDGFEYVFTQYPLDMEVDVANNYVYVSWGNPNNGKLGKFSLSDAQLIGSPVRCGRLPDSIALTNDGSKIYVLNREFKISSDPTPNTYCELEIFDTASMLELDPIILDVIPADLAMGYDNRLYASNNRPYDEDNTPQSLYIIDTLIDQIIGDVSLADNMGIWDIQVDPINQKLFGTVCTRDYFDPVVGAYYHQDSPIIVWFDLDDPSYLPTFFTMSTENLILMAVAPVSDYSKVFAITNESSTVYYDTV